MDIEEYTETKILKRGLTLKATTDLEKEILWEIFSAMKFYQKNDLEHHNRFWVYKNQYEDYKLSYLTIYRNES